MKTEPKKSSKSWFYPVIYLVIGLIIGVFIAVQIATTETIARSTNPIEPALELDQTISEMKAEQQLLKDEIVDLRVDVKSKEDTIEERRSTSKELSADLDKFENIVGLTALKGQGVEITLDDGHYEGLKDRNDFKNDAIIHSTDILDVVNLLWAAGAEAIAINKERIVNSTSINCIVNTILVNESHVGTPLKIQAIGEAEELAEFIKDPGRLTDLHQRRKDYGLVLDVVEVSEVFIDAYTGTYEI